MSNKYFKGIRAKISESSCVPLPLQSYRIFLELFFVMGANWVVEVSMMYNNLLILIISSSILEFFFLCVLVGFQFVLPPCDDPTQYYQL